MRANGKVLAGLLILSLACVGATPAAAGVVDLGGGWEASWDASLDNLVTFETVDIAGDVLIVQKTARFTQPPVGVMFPSIPIVFRQVAWPAATQIVIDSESIQNSTGVDWTDFHLILLGGNAVFDPVSTANSGGPAPIGWKIDPFAQAAFDANLKRLDIWGGLVPDGGLWQPGIDPAGGGLWINAFPNPDVFTSFTLKETPTPEPAAMVLLASGGAVILLSKRGRRGDSRRKQGRVG